MNKISWRLFEQWATAKAIKFGLDDGWVDLVLWIVSKRVEAERSCPKQIVFDSNNLL